MTSRSTDTGNTDTNADTTTQSTSTADTVNNTSGRHRPRHLPYVPDTATPWWALVASQESDNSTDEPWTIEEARRDIDYNAVINPLAQPEIPLETSLENSLENKDLWHRLRSDFRLNGQEHHLVRPYIDWYARHQPYLDRVTKRARPFLYDIVQEIEARDMPMEIALLPVVESAFQPFAYSSGRAAGIWQFIPSTGKHYGLKQNWWYDGRRDVPKATKAALDYLEYLHKRFDGDWLLALASYNSGEGRVARAVKKNKKKGRPTDFWSLDLPKETQGYVPKLLAISAIVQHNKKHGITLTSIPDAPYLEHVDTGSQIDLALAAELAELPIETMYQLNPAYNRWATDPKGPHTLLLPIHKADTFREALARVDKKNRVRWERHRIREGETLGQIARKFQTSVVLLQEVNNIRDKWIRAGQSIIIPVATRNLEHYLSEDRRRVALQSTKRTGYKLQHTVKRGDTFWDISRKYNVKVSQLASWNGMSPKDTLKPGQQLALWTKKPNLANRQFVSLPRSITHQQVHYRVRKGDSLARIAQKFSVTVANLRQWNSLKKGKYLQPGQRLTLYVDVTQQS
ncbi:MAG: LysM peptidoglycan-binding domain-containing protein [Gammaproteobacteria bacterium]|nr:LysM peptidoglycan-binding domain-containing protein [Gammaproteobacteria bacterium]